MEVGEEDYKAHGGDPPGDFSGVIRRLAR